MSKLIAPTCVLEKMLCITCKKHLSVFPIYTRVDGSGAVCGRCKITSDDKFIHDEAYENIAQFLAYHCAYKANGCEESLTPSSLEEHENSCVFRKLDCPTKNVSKCQWQGIHIDLPKHFEEKHSGLLLKDAKFELNFAHSCNEIGLLTVRDELFIVKKEIDAGTEKFSCSIQQIRSGDNPQNYKYFLRLLNGDNTYSCKFSEKSTFAEDNTTKFDGSFVREKLHNPTSIIVIIEIIHINTEDLEDPTTINDIKKDPNINWELLSELECPICFDFMLPPIYQCVEGHSVCCECKPKITTCPLCKKSVNDTKNFSLEKMTKYLTYPCKFYKMGCTYSCKSTYIKNHEEGCEYGPYKCPLHEVEKCQWKSSSSQMVTHVANDHNAYLVKSNRIDINFKKDDSSEYFYLIRFSQKIFKIYCKYENEKFYWTVQLVGPAKDSRNYKFEIDVIDNSENKLRRYSVGFCSPLTGNDDSFADRCNYLTMSLEEIYPLNTTTLSYKVHVFK